MLAIVMVTLGTIVASFVGGVGSKVIYDKFDRPAMVRLAMASFAALSLGACGFCNFGSTGILLGLAGVVLGWLVWPVLSALSTAPELQVETYSWQNNAEYRAKEEAKFQATLVIFGALINGIVGGVLTWYAVQWFGAGGLFVAAIGSVIGIVALSGFVAWIGMLILGLVWICKRFCRLAIATALKITGGS